MNYKPSEVFIMPNDKMPKKLFAFNINQFKLVFAGTPYNVIEGEKKLKSKIFKVKSPTKLKAVDETQIEELTATPLDMFDRAVLSACITEWKAGNKQTSTGVIYRHICGKPLNKKCNPTEKQADLILKSVDKMRRILLWTDLSEVCKYFGYNGGKEFVIDYEAILPCRIDKGVVGGGSSQQTIFLDGESPLLKIATIKNKQLLTFDDTVFDTGSKHNTRSVIGVKFYVADYVLQTISHNLTPALTFEKIFNECSLTDISRKTKMQIRNVISALMENLKKLGKIKNFEMIRKGDKFYSVEFQY